jgi:hypothetical protein
LVIDLTALGALFEQRHLPGEIGELPFEVGERLLLGTVRILADHSLAVRLTDVDGTVVVDTAPRFDLWTGHAHHPCCVLTAVDGDRDRSTSLLPRAELGETACAGRFRLVQVTAPATAPSPR